MQGSASIAPYRAGSAGQGARAATRGNGPDYETL